jgi:hypothetical protein
MMQIRTGQVKHLPYKRLEETMEEEVYMIGWSADRLDRSTSTHNHRSLRSTGLRLAVVIHKLSNVKLDRRWSGMESVQSLHSNDKRSLNLAAPADRYLIGLWDEGATPRWG